MEAVAFAQTREAGPRTPWFIATGTAAASRCIKVNTQPPAGPNRPAPNRHCPPPSAATATAAPPPARPPARPPADPPRPARRPREPGVVAAGAGRASACGRKCVWPGLSCDSALTLSSVIWWLAACVGPGLRLGRVGACDPRWSPRDCVVPLGTVGFLPPPLPAPVAAVCQETSCDLGQPASSVEGEREGGPCCTPSSLAEILLPATGCFCEDGGRH